MIVKALLLFCLSLPAAPAVQQIKDDSPVDGTAVRAGTASSLYLSDQRVVTFELANSSTAILNYINLGTNYELIEAPMLVVVDQSGRGYRGHLFQKEESDPAQPFFVSKLMKPGEFGGFTLRGNFDLASKPAKILLRISGRVLVLEMLEEEVFELVAARIAEMDLLIQDRKTMIERAGFNRGFGSLHFAGAAESSEYDRYFGDEEILPPVPIANPLPLLPDAYAAREDPVLVKLRVSISRSGGIKEVELAQGIDSTLDQLALETVRNSWIFLPAISRNEVAESEVTLNIAFRRN